MRPSSICRKAILVILTSLLIFSLSGNNLVASKTLAQTTCGEWNLTLNGERESSQDGKISVNVIHSADSRCEGVYTLKNKTGIASIGGYTLELVVDSQNANVRVLETALLTPYRPIDIKAEPQDKDKAALVNIQGQMTKEAYLFDFAYLSGKSIINHLVPLSQCVIPHESLAMVTIRLMDITSHAAAEFGEGNFRAASEEFSGIFDALLEAMIESLKEAGENCAVDALKLKLGKVGSQKLQIFLDVAKWLVPWYRDYFKGEWSYLTLSYFAAGKTDVTPVPTLTVVSQTRTVEASEPTPQGPDPKVDYTDMIYIPAGEFQMGCNINQVDFCPKSVLPVQLVYVDAFFIDKYEVTNGEYKECVEIGICDPPEGFENLFRYRKYENPEYDNYPVSGVNPENAQAFCSWWGKRLPFEMEWEKAALGTKGILYPWGNEKPNCSLANFRSCAGEETMPVGSYPAGSSPYGLMDMAGNVEEWTRSMFDNGWVIRGGGCDSWNDNDLKTYTNGGSAYTTANIGFRCAADAEIRN